ncbi:sodium:solute symporter family transporter [Geoalkalibacter subterraneus]|uniref:Stage II sporulation protein E n=1 Tax=Geoalkalibacter subterraneus TaxID=483547 RepID=A0A0B5FS13_9BACT|nr:SpoIIE family protein phosphatase [Geoalkalibacter subterraneus]AJF06935.1 stage II sporulation protein E [Geoalkalibacter subterraneus]
MIPIQTVALITLTYFALLFFVAYYADKRRQAGRSIISNSHIYSLSLAVYVTTWTFYGSVGRAATSGLDFLPVYLGPTLIAFTWWFLLRKMVRVSKEQNIVSIADFISSRYGKSSILGAIVTLFAVVGIMPYIALQLKAVARTFEILTTPADGTPVEGALLATLPPYIDTAFIVAVVLALFGVLFGARRLDAAERHEGLVAAIALESLVKIIAFMAVGIFVTYGLFDGFGDIFTRFAATFPDRQYLLQLGTDQVPYAKWFTVTFISMMAVMFLPRQFHIMVIENSDENHIRKAMWRFPLYMFMINLFVIPIALGGLLLTGGDTSAADYFVLFIPHEAGQTWLAMLIFLGGFSGAAGMVMVSSVALATMILNHLVMPIIIRLHIHAADLSGFLVNVKRLAIVAVIFQGYLYYKVIGDSLALVNIGLISFVAATQFAPAVIGGLYWKRGNVKGATAGILLGFCVWFYTLLVPSFVRSGWLKTDIMEKGLFDLAILRPTELFGLSGFDALTHSLFWSLFFNLSAYLVLSLFCRRHSIEQEQAEKFVDAYGYKDKEQERQRISKAPTVMEFVDLMAKFIGEKQAHSAISEYLGNSEIDERGSLSEYDLPHLKRFTERTLAGSVGAAPARIIIDNYLSARGSKMEDVFDIFGSVTLSRTTSREQLGVLYEAARIVASGRNLDDILEDILDLLTQQFKFDLCVIRIIDEDSNTLVVRCQKGMTSQHLGESERDISRETYIGEAFLTNSVIKVNDTDFLDKPQSAQIIHREGIKSFAHAPITIEGQPIGVLSAFSRSVKGIFTDEFIELFRSLAGQIGIAWRNAMQTKELIEARGREREMEIAKNIQMSLLPTHVPKIEGITLAGMCVPARQVGGDYYDFLVRGENGLDIVIADVSGHNVGAALLMAETRAFIQARADGLGTPAEILDSLNRFFYEDLTRTELFITMFYLHYDAADRKILYANAGHNPPLLWRSESNTCEWLDAEGLILGVKPSVEFIEIRDQLHPGDMVLLYTDGITEAENDRGEFFGRERLCGLLNENSDDDPKKVLNMLLDQVRLFTGVQHFTDDVTMAIMKIQK